MASEERHSENLVAAAEFLSPVARRLNFFQLVAYLERLTAKAVRVGELGPVLEEQIRFRHDPSLGFSSGDVSDVSLRQVASQEEDDLARRPLFEVVTTFLGLTGSSSPLPMYVAEEIAQEDPDRPVRREFLDLFHHRLLSLFFRIESRYRVTSELTSSCDDQWSKRILALAGFDTFVHAKTGKLPAWRMLRIAPILASYVRTAEKLEMALQDVLGDALGEARVSVRQFMGRWVDIDAKMQLGRANHQLGRNTLLGGKAFDRTGKFQVEIGPLAPQTWRRLMPEGDLYPMAREVVNLCVRDPLEYTFELFLSESVNQTFHLNRNEPSRLGRDTWLGTNRQNRITVQGSAQA
ncbi:type VI secretion system baseplate subunit TssG [Stigmatella sp. ncwal1]|uniref:Type VI secretion system baseplate subunit TssG n=1 Tax=Stigmatella ashevillensis TaxID=2995309 RepID=A0ABT5DBV8_9BACT|nr:type VI secretion system baseplate subunit TssG [Stigmatella ashevillena]MDC0711157.1 type VI secretion system baseplate subunit TssG [Stigmatella ashevillena]